MVVNVPDLIITSLDTIEAYALTGEYRFLVDELQDATISNTQDKSDITGKQGRKLGSLKKNKGVTIKGTNGLLSAGMTEAQVGSKFEKKESTPVAYREQIVINGNTATTEYIAVGTAGAEITALYVLSAGGWAEKKLEQSDAVASDKFTYNPATKTLAFNEDDYPDGTTIHVAYTRNVPGNVLVNHSDKYSEKLRLYVDGTAEDKCGSIYHVQWMIPKADFNGNFDITLGGDQATHAFEAESLAGSCGMGGALWTQTVFGIDAADVDAGTGV